MTRSDSDAFGPRTWPQPRLVSALSRRRVMAGIAAAWLALCATASAQDAPGAAAGENAWDKAGCLQCHGASGEGGDGGEFPAGPSLRKTRLDRAALAETISCGLPGTQMPAWLDGAYTRAFMLRLSRPARPPLKSPRPRCSAPAKSRRWSTISWPRSSGDSPALHAAIRANRTISARRRPRPFACAQNSRTGSPSAGRCWGRAGIVPACSSSGFPPRSPGRPPPSGSVP